MGIEWKDALEVLSPITVIFLVGKASEKLKQLGDKTDRLDGILGEWSGMKVRLEKTEEAAAKGLSLHRQLSEDYQRTIGKLERDERDEREGE